jgi:hypothetical protein
MLASCGVEDAARPARDLHSNLVVVTACGLRADLLEAACASGTAPALAQLEADAAVAATIATNALDCLPAHASLFFGAAPASATDESFVAAAAARGARTAAFTARTRVARGAGAGDFGFATCELPPIERFSLSMFGDEAAALEPRRDDDATVAAALAWLAHAGTPFVLWVELDALALDGDAPGEGLRDAALRRIAAVDRAVAALRRELTRADRNLRTCFVLTADHGEALGEEGAFGHRRPLDAVVRVPLRIVDPEEPGRWRVAPPRDLATLGAQLRARLRGEAAGAATATNAAALDRSNAFDFDGPLALDYERGRPPLTDHAAHAALPRLRADVAARPDVLPIAEHYLVALHALDAPSAEEAAELAAARVKWLERVAFGMPHRPLAASLFARFGKEVGATPERREAAALQAVRAAPWYFPAVRALAVSFSLRAPARAVAAMEEFGATAPLAPAAHAEFVKNLELTRRNLGLAPK